MGINRFAGTPWHFVTLVTDDHERRHKTHCLNYDQGDGDYYLEHCRGAAYCSKYVVGAAHAIRECPAQKAAVPLRKKETLPPIKSDPAPLKRITPNCRVKLFDLTEQRMFCIIISNTIPDQAVKNHTVISEDSSFAQALLNRSIFEIIRIGGFEYRIADIIATES